MRSIAMAVMAAALLHTGAAHAIDRECPRGQVWDPNQGSCIKKVRVDKRSPAQKYYEAIEHLEGTAKNPRPDKGVNLLQSACAARHAPACTLLGFLYRSGRGVEADGGQSVRFYDTACKLDDPNGCVGAAEVHARARNYEKAIPYLETACKMKSGRGCWELAEKYYYAFGVKADGNKASALYAQAFGLLKTDCAQRNAPACYALGLAHAHGKGTAESPADAFNAFLAGCDAGSGDACNQVGASYNGGDGVKQDIGQAQKYWELACRKYDSAVACHDAGLTIAQNGEASSRTNVQNQDLMQLGDRACTLDRHYCDLIGYLYGTGRGGQENQDLAAKWYLVGCENGSAASCSSVAYRSFKGIGMKKDADQAMAFWQKACDLKWQSACTELGNRYYEGEIVTKDLAKAYDWFYLGCLRDDAEGCHSTAWALQKGETADGKKDPVKALQYYKKACDEMRRAAACVDKGRFLKVGGDGVEADPDQASAAFDLACELGHDSGCMDLGDMHFNGTGVPKDDLKAGQAYLRACKLGHAKTCYWIDGLYKNGRANATQNANALAGLEEACADGKEHACIAVAAVFGWGGHIGAKNGRKAFALYQDGCKRGVKEACIQLGHCYANGIGVVPDQDKAKQLFTEQCNGELPAACTWLGHRFYVEKKYDQAAPLFRRACDDKDAVGCLMIGFSHYAKHGVSWDLTESRKAYEIGCDLGNENSCNNLGEMYDYGIGVDADAKKAFEFYGKACTPSSTSGCGNLARFYAAGLGGAARDAKRAETEYTRACEEGADGAACRALADILAASGKAKPARLAALRQKALALIEEEAKTNPWWQYQLGLLHRDGVAVVKDPVKATELFASACDGYDPLGCLAAGQMYMGDRGVPANLEAAKVRFERGCAAGLNEACTGADKVRAQLGGDTGGGGGVAPLKKKGSCACAGAGAGDPAGLFLVLAAGLLALSRRKKTRLS